MKRQVSFRLDEDLYQAIKDLDESPTMIFHRALHRYLNQPEGKKGKLTGSEIQVLEPSQLINLGIEIGSITSKMKDLGERMKYIEKSLASVGEIQRNTNEIQRRLQALEAKKWWQFWR